MLEEIWRPIKGYKDYYEVSSYGNVRSVDKVVVYSNGRKRLQKGKMMKPKKRNNGYLQIKLCKSGEEKKMLIHRLVAQAFIPNPDNLPIVNHKDENKTNNHVDNIEWCDSKYNINYGTRNEKVAVKLSMPVLQIDLETNKIIAEYPSSNEAGRQLNISQSTISKCCRGQIKTYKGFKWRYKE